VDETSRIARQLTDDTLKFLKEAREKPLLFD
jgi:hypothetical protein